MTFLHDVKEFILSWYRQDRIRISPTEGRLLGLRPGDCFVFRNEYFQIQSREVSSSELGLEVALRMTSSVGASRLQLSQPTGQTLVCGRLSNERDTVEVFDEDIAGVESREPLSVGRASAIGVKVIRAE